MWRLLYSKYKLNRKEKCDLQAIVSFTCGAQIQGLNKPGHLNDVRQMSCIEHLFAYVVLQM